MSKPNTKHVKIISERDWSTLVQNTYGRPYDFQQQEDCRKRGTVYITVPDAPVDYERDEVPEEVNGEIMGVSFKAWLARDPKQNLVNTEDEWDKCDDGRILWWERNFYPHVSMIANDLHTKGLLDAGEYGIEVEW